MAKPKRVRPTTSRIGSKINIVLDEKGMPGDYAALAKEFDVALTSVYGWVDNGRISKSRLPKLADWSGRPLEWWLDTEPTAPQDAAIDGQAIRPRVSPEAEAAIDLLTELATSRRLLAADWVLLTQFATRLAKPKQAQPAGPDLPETLPAPRELTGTAAMVLGKKLTVETHHLTKADFKE